MVADVTPVVRVQNETVRRWPMRYQAEQDGAAVRAAFTSPWSNGPTEGQITKLRLLKRTMYGRANFDLLRRRVVLAA